MPYPDLPQGQTNFCKHREDHNVSKCDTCCPATDTNVGTTAKDTNVPTKGYVETVLEQFDELLSHYKSSFDGKNSAVNRMRRRTNDTLEQEIKIFIRTSLETLIERQISEIEKLIEDENDKLKVRFFHGLPYNLNYTDGLLKSILLLQSFLPTNEIKR